MSAFLRLMWIAAAAALAGCATPQSQLEAQGQSAPQPAEQFYVIAANPLAAEAGMNVLRRGGSAVDAAIAVEAMLSLVEPQSSGLGGGAFMTYYDAPAGRVSVYDGRETAPAGATPDMFLDDDGEALPFSQAVVSGRATGVPGVVRMLEMAHREHGRLPWSGLFGDAERTAREGFIVSPRLGRFTNGSYPQSATPDVRAYFAEADGTPVDPGDRLRNPAYADFLRRLASQGPDALYRGETAGRIVARTAAGPLPGTMTTADLAGYRPVKRDPLCRPYRAYVVCVPPPPSSGVALLQLMGMLERTDIAGRGPADPQAWYLFAEASRLMYADRDRYVGDPAFVSVPTAGLLDPTYVAGRAALIGPQAGPPPLPGTPPGAMAMAPDMTREPAGTTHFIVGDAQGNVVSMTATVESIFGSGRMVDGFFLNNEMTDFSFQPRDAQGRPAANAVAPGKRPRSSMTPAIILTRDGRYVGALGSPGGNSILAYVGKALVGVIDWNLPMQEAIALPNLIARGSSYQGEVGRFPPAVLEGLRARGITVRSGQGEDSGLHGVILRQGRVDGGADPRREGVVRVESGR
ncbi:MAG: gamma-glutamyltransferase [Allosphingosinicella sp.]|uniref:gamma-glutamyltransferase n=1 Tax=Allosphingosinicella sp. TaxID=2823234 RepID=UPI00392927F6